MLQVVDHAARDNSTHLGQEILAIAKMPKLPTVIIYLLFEKESKLKREKFITNYKFYQGSPLLINHPKIFKIIFCGL